MAGRSIRLYVRTKKRYEPSHFQSQLWYIDVTDFAGCSVGDIKRKCHKETLAKVEDLFYLNQSLADDRSVAHYNFPDEAILETTSNPLWVAMIHVKMVEIERERDSNPHDHHVQRWTHRSYAKKTTLLSVLFNAKKHDNVQPPHFPVYEDFILYLERLGRKGANINPHYSGQDFQRWFAEHLQQDLDRPDPIRAFQARHAARLGLHPAEGQSSGNSKPKKTSNSSGNKGKGKQPMKRTTPTATRTRPARQERVCEDCEEGMAEIYCPSCEGSGGSSGVVLCMDCTHRIHQGALRGRHDCTHISQAPRALPAPQQYLPHPYKSPFAVLLAMTRALKENEHKLSLNEEEIKQRAQPITDTDLHDKPVGKMMGGFDCMDNTLIPKNLVQKEAANRHTFALTQSGRALGQKLDIFDSVLQRFLTDSGVPQPPSTFRSGVGGRQVVLVMDARERDAARLSALARSAGVTVVVRSLQVADYVWVLSPDCGGSAVPYDGSQAEQEMMLPVLVERKSWHDLHDSIRLGRWTTQLHRMKSCGLLLNFVLVEGCLTDLRQVSQDRRDFLQAEVERLSVEEGFHIGRTFTWAKSAAWLFWMTHILTMAYSEGLFREEMLPFKDLAPRMMRGERERRLGGTARPLTPRGSSCVWEPDRLVTAIFRDSLKEEKMADMYQREFPHGPTRQLLVLQNLEVYNKNRQNLLLTALRQAASLENYTHDSVRGVTEQLLMGELKHLVHYDVLGFWILTLQVRQQVYVLRTETEADTQRLQHWFSQDQQLPEVGEVKERDRQGEEEDLTAEDRREGEREGEKPSCVAEDFAWDSQAEERMLQEALSLSLISTLEREDPDDTKKTTVSQIVVPERESRHLEQREQLTSQPLCGELPPLPQHNSSVVKEAWPVPERSPSPLGFTEDDAILIDSQGLDDGVSAGVEVEGWAVQDRGGSEIFPGESLMAETVASTLETEQAVKESVLKEDEALAKRLQAEENLKTAVNFTRVKGKTVVGSEGEGRVCAEGEGWRQDDVNSNRYKCRDSNKTDVCLVDRTVADCVINPSMVDLTHSQHRPLQTDTVSKHSLSSPRKRPAQTFTLSPTQPKKLKSQVESDEELARRLQRELDSDGGVDHPENSSLSQKDFHTSSVDRSASCASSLEKPRSKEKEEDEIIAIRLQEEEMLGLSVDITGSAGVSKCRNRDSVLKRDEALARGLQQAEKFQGEIPLLSAHTSSQASGKTADMGTKQHCVKDLLDSIKKEEAAVSYIESDEELARRLQEEEERGARKTHTSLPSPVHTRRLSGKRGAMLNTSLEEDDRRLARQLQTEQEVEVLGNQRGDKAQGMLGGTVGVGSEKQESHKGTCHTRPSIDLTEEHRHSDLKQESKPCIGVVEHRGHGMDLKLKGDCGNPAGASNGHVGEGAHLIKGSTLSGQHHHSSMFEDGLAPVPQSPSTTVTSNVRCGSCGEKGHNRRFERCPNYYTEKEKKRRDAMEEAHRQRAEDRAREAEERQREEQRALQRLAVTRNILQHNKEQMMQQIATATQQCANQFQSQLDDIDRLINSKQRKQKTAQAKQKKQ